MVEVSDFDQLPADHAGELLRQCCGASQWVAAMVSRRPFGTLDLLLSAAETIWRSLSADDWREAFRHHPRIGERTAEAQQSALGQEWSAGEQASMLSADDDARRMLAEANRNYEQRFGYIYIVNATGKTPDMILRLAQQRLAHDPDLELRIAANEQEQIMRLRLEKMFRQRRNEGSPQ